MYIIEAIRRTKENKNLKRRCIRHIVKSDNIEKDISILKEIVKQQGEPGMWRIYRTVNRRDSKRAMKVLQHRMIEENIHDRLESAWKTALLQRESRSEDLFLLDIDSNSLTDFMRVRNILEENNIQEIESEITPNGHHIVVKSVDSRLFKDLEYVEIKRDALLFLRIIE